MTKITKMFMTLLLLLVAGVANAGEQTSIYTIDYSTAESYPFYRMGTPEGSSFDVIDGLLVIENTKSDGNVWDLQPFIADGFTVQEGYDYLVKIDYKTTTAGSVNIGFGNWSNSMAKYGVGITVADDFQTMELTFSKATFGSENNNHILWQCRSVVGTMSIKKVEVIEIAPDEPIKEPVWTAIIDNDARCFRSKEYPSVDVLPVKSENGEYVVNSPAKVADAWETQFWIRLPQTLEAGKKFKISFDYKASAAATVETQSQNEPGKYIHWACIGNVEFTDGWQTFDKTITVPSECDGSQGNGFLNDFHSIAFNLSMAEGIDYYFKNIKVEVDEDDVATEFDYPDPIYTVAGTEDLCGTAWNTRANVMTYDAASGLFMWGAKDITVNNDNKPEFKVVKDCNWDTCWPDNNWIITPDVLGGEDTYNIIITFNAENNVIAVLNEDLLAEVEELAADESAVAVGKLLAAIEAYKGNGNVADLQAAVNQFKADNADQEKDETAKVATNGWKKFDGSNAGVCATQFAPAITTYDGRTAQLAEVYEEGEPAINRTGTIIYQDITGLANGTYKVGFYGNAFFTSGRGFDSTMEDGATDVAYVFANDQKEFITARIATSTTENDFRQFDVEVTDGNIKLGMGKEKPGTNWHTMQIYQLTWFTTAKEVFAELYREFNVKLFAAATVLDDENKTNGREAFQAAVNAAEAVKNNIKMYNISELEAELAKLTAAVTTFQQANWYIDFAAGEYYVINATTGLKMAAGHDWGTRGIVNEAGLDLTLTPYEQSRTVTFDSRVSNGGNSHFLGSNLYMDSSEWGWALEYQGFGFYILEPNSGKYINLDADNNLVLSDTPCEWIIVSKDGVRAQLLEEMAEATKDNPVDATGLIVAQNFNRNDARNAEAWSVSVDCTNSNLSGGNNVNNNAESYHSTFTIMQTIQGAPAGFYQLTAQGFYRQDNFEGDVPAAPVFFANGVNGDVPVLAEGGPDGMSAASEAFTNGDYTIDPINFEVKEDGMMYIGITASTNTQWVIWDNFRLMYFGQDNPTTGITTVNSSVNQNVAAIYNLNGQRVMNAQKGLYIMNGKKVVLK